jgi:O-antigen ligase
VAKGSSGIRSQRTGQHKWLFAFIFFAGCSVLWSIEPALSLQAVRRLVSLVVFYFLVIRLVDTRDKLRVVLLMLLVSSIIAAFFAIWSYSQGAAVFDTQSEIKVDGRLRASGLSLDANFFAATILTALPICLLMVTQERHPGIRALLVAGALALVLGTIYSFSRGGALTLAIVVLMVFGVHLTRLSGRGLLGALGAGAMVLLIGLAFVPENYASRIQSLGSISGDESLRGRMLYVEYGSEAVLESPLGVGAGSFPVAFRQSAYNQMYTYYDTQQGDSPQGRSAHNMYLEVAVETGLLGGALFLGLVVFALFENVRTGRHIREKGDDYLLAANQTIGVALASFAFAGLFLSAQYEKILWLLLALVPVMKNLGYEGEIFMPDLRKLRRALARHEQTA